MTERNATWQKRVSLTSYQRLIMKSASLLFLLLTAIMLVSCKNDEEGSLTIHFAAEYEGMPLEMFETKAHSSGDQLQFVHLSLLASDLWLEHISDSHKLKDIELVDMSFDDPSSALEGFTLHIDQIPANAYQGLRFGIGVPADLNAREPSDFGSTSPLSKNGYYWSAWESYIFMKIEGRFDNAGDGNFDTAFAYHTGSDDLYRILTTPIPITIENGENTEITVFIDYKDLLDGIDIRSNPQNHNPQDSIQIARIVNNLGNAISIQ